MIKIDRDRCDGCGACIEACPYGALRLKDSKAEIDYRRCVQCGTCIDICPTGAIREAVQQFAGANRGREVNYMMGQRFYGRGFGMGYGRGFGRGMGMGFGRGFGRGIGIGSGRGLGRGSGFGRCWWTIPYAGYYGFTPPYANYGYRSRPY